MSEDDRRTEGQRDPLRALLQTWRVDPPGDGLERRLREAFGRRQGRSSRWVRLLHTSVRVPLPLLAALVLLCLVSSAIAVRRAMPRERPEPAAGSPAVPSLASTRAASFRGYEPVLAPRLTVIQEEER
jgi:hypothetical protein